MRRKKIVDVLPFDKNNPKKSTENRVRLSLKRSKPKFNNRQLKLTNNSKHQYNLNN